MLIRATFVLALLAALPAHATNPVASFTANRTSCAAPCDVYFDARATSDPDLAQSWQRLIDLTYTWDFGDPGSGNWAYGASHHSKNVDTGFVAGHVYETPGTYTVTLRVSDGQSVAQQQRTVTVTSTDSAWPGSQTVCVTANTAGSFAGCPAGAKQVTTSDFDQALKDPGFCNLDNQGGRCLFRRGDAFDVDAEFVPNNAADFLIGAFGSGAKPQVRFTRSNLFIVHGGSGPNRKTYVDLDVRGTDAPGQQFLEIWGKVEQTLIFRVEMRDLNMSINLYAGWNFPDDASMPHHVSIVESSSLSNLDGDSYPLFTSAQNLLFLGNNFGDMDGRHHVLRFMWLNGASISHNSVGRGCGSDKQVIKIHNEKWNQGAFGCSRDFLLADNLIEGCSANAWDVSIMPNKAGDEVKFGCMQHFVVERNQFRQNRTSYEWGAKSLLVSGQGVAIRNNIFDMSGNSVPTATPTGVAIWLWDPGQSVPPDDVRVYNNTCYASLATKGDATCIEVGNAQRTIVKNNLMYDPAGHARTNWPIWNRGAINPTFCSDGSVGSCNMYTTTTPFVSSAPFSFSDFALRVGSPALDAGEAVISSGADTVGTTYPNFPRDGNGDGIARLNVGAFEANGGQGVVEAPPVSPPPAAAPPAPPTLLDVR